MDKSPEQRNILIKLTEMVLGELPTKYLENDSNLRKAFELGREYEKFSFSRNNTDWIEMLDELLEAAECAHDWFYGLQVDGIDDKDKSSVAATEKLYQAIVNTKKWQSVIEEK